MAKIESLHCKGCGSPLDRENLKECPYCGSANFIKSEVNPMKMNNEMAQKYVSFFRQKSTDNPRDTNALFAMGLLYMGLKNYELAQRNFKEAIDQSPMEADMYYYYALSLIGGKSIKSLHGNDIKRIEEYLQSALGIEVKCKYLMLLMAVKQEYYLGNGLKITGDTPAELYDRAQDYAPDDLDEIREHVQLRNPDTIGCFNELTGKDQEDSGSSVVVGNGGDNFLTVEQREQYFNYKFPPVKPSRYGELLPEKTYSDIPSYPVFGRIWKLILSILLMFVILIVLSIANWGIIEGERTIYATSIADSINNEAAASGKKLTKKEWDKLYSEMKADSIEQAQNDSIFRSQTIFPITKQKGNVEEIVAIKKKGSSIIWMLILFAPLIVWIVSTIVYFSDMAHSRKRAIAHNSFVNQLYREETELYNTKPTDEQMNAFVVTYLSNIVDIELSYHNKNEDDLKGKILFVNDYFQYKDDPENYENSAVEYTVVLLEDTHVTILKNDWRIYEANPDRGESETVFYSDIKSVRLTEGELSFGDSVIDLPDGGSIFEYQNRNTSSALTFSNDRTSDPKEFKAALDKLVNSYKNR